MAVYTNDLRLKEIATGDESGTWGTSTNTNLELIAEAFSFGTEAITTNADTHTTTIADGSTDPGRSIFLKYTGTLDSACTITIGPNTVSKLWLIENATSGSQNIIIKQGSGATVTIANGQTKAIYSDGAGSGGAMVDAFQDLSIPDLFIDDDLTFTSDSAVITFGADGDTTLTHTDGSGLTLNSTNKLMFNDASQFIQGSSATVLSLGATDEIDLTATAIDVNGTIDVSGNATLGGTLGVTGAVTANAGVSIDNITIDGQEIDVSSGNLTLDSAGEIILDADGGNVIFHDGGVNIGRITNDSSNLRIQSDVDDKDIIFRGKDGSSFITALTLDMSNAGAALFNGAVTTGDTITVNSGSLNLASDGGTLFIGADIDMRLTHDGSNGTFRCDTGSMTFDVAGGITLDADGGQVDFKDGGTLKALIDFTTDNVEIQARATDGDLIFRGQDGSSFITALTLDMSAVGAATFNSGATFGGNVTINSTTLKVSGDFPQLLFEDTAGSDVDAYIVNNANGLFIGKTNSPSASNDIVSIDLSTGGVVFNEASNDADFRVESNGNANMLFVDASSDAIGIGGTTMDEKLNIQTASTGEKAMIAFRNTQAGTQVGMPANVNALTFTVADTERWRIDSNGVLVSGGNTAVGLCW